MNVDLTTLALSEELMADLPNVTSEAHRKFDTLFADTVRKHDLAGDSPETFQSGLRMGMLLAQTTVTLVAEGVAQAQEDETVTNLHKRISAGAVMVVAKAMVTSKDAAYKRLMKNLLGPILDDALLED